MNAAQTKAVQGETTFFMTGGKNIYLDENFNLQNGE